MTTYLADAEGLFRRHLNLAPLGQRSRGAVLCPFHKDRRPSMSVDLDRGVFYCFGCGAGGGVKRFRELVAEAPAGPLLRRTESPLQEARRRAAEQLRREEDHVREWEPMMICAEFIGRMHRGVDGIRQLVAELGPSHPRTWPALALAAKAETEAAAVEAEFDDILASGRVA